MLYTDGLVERRNIPLDAGIKAAADLLAEGARSTRTPSPTTSCRA